MALPAILREGVTRSAVNIDSTWIGLEVECFLTDRLGRPVHVLNDADTAGLAEVRYGAGRGPGGHPARGTVLVLLLGTGNGSALFVDGRLVPNLELGHLELADAKAETRASAVAREREHLDWPDYARRLQRYLSHLEFLLSPGLIIVGGAVSARHEDFIPHLHLDTPSCPPSYPTPPGSSAPPATPTTRHRPCRSRITDRRSPSSRGGQVHPASAAHARRLYPYPPGDPTNED